MKTSMILASLVSASLMSAGSTAFADSVRDNNSTFHSESETTQNLIESLVADANAWTQSLEKPESKELFLSNYYDDLAELGKQSTFEEKASLTVGSWREVWSSEQNPTPPNLLPVLGEVYQVILPDGVGFNIGVRNLVISEEQQFKVTSIIELGATVNAAEQKTEVEFFKSYQKQGDVSAEPSLTAFVQGILNNERADVVLQEPRFFPNGPIGATGFLKTIYADDNIRVVEGPNAFSGATDYFVLERTDTPL